MTNPKPSLDTNDFLPSLDATGSGPPTITVDLAEFEHFLEGTGWSDAQKREYLEMLWRIVSEFVALGFGFHPVQHAMSTRTEDEESCGKLPETGAPRPDRTAHEVQWTGTNLNKPFENAAARVAVSGGGKRSP